MDEIAVYLMYSDVFGRKPDASEIPVLISDLEFAETASVICQLNAELRLVNRDRDSLAKVQTEWAAFLFDDDTIDRLKRGFGNEHLADRPVFHAPQLLNVLKFIIDNSAGDRNPRTDDTARYRLGTACLMVNDLFLNSNEKEELASDNTESKGLALITQMLATHEVINAAPMSHIIYRSFILFDLLVKQKEIAKRISDGCGGFDLEREFADIVKMSLQHWRFLIFAFCSYLMNYVGPDGSRNLEYLAVDRTMYRGTSSITSADLDIVLTSVGSGLSDFRTLLADERPTDWRFDFTPFRSRPLIECAPNKFFCSEIGFLVEKMHSGVYWAINDGLPSNRRPQLFSAWGILFEEYVNWFLGGCNFKSPLAFYATPRFVDGSECFDGALAAGDRFVPMEYKGGLLRLNARYSGSAASFEADLDLKIGKGCEQLARKIQVLFNRREARRKRLQEIPLQDVTRVIPVLVVHDHLLRGPLVNWLLNKKFHQLLDRSQLRHGVIVDSLNVVSINELETMAQSSEAGNFDILYGLQLRCHNDPEMLSDLHNFLLKVPGYGQGKSTRVENLLAEQWAAIEQYLFGAEKT
jgi:hypothetical protein